MKLLNIFIIIALSGCSVEKDGRNDDPEPSYKPFPNLPVTPDPGPDQEVEIPINRQGRATIANPIPRYKYNFLF